MSALLKRVVAVLVSLYKRNPARAISYTVAAVVTIAGALGVVVNAQSLEHILIAVVPILVTGEATHQAHAYLAAQK